MVKSTSVANWCKCFIKLSSTNLARGFAARQDATQKGPERCGQRKVRVRPAARGQRPTHH